MHSIRNQRFWRFVGVLMLLHLVFLCIVKMLDGTQEDVVWMCHVTLGIAGIGLMLRSTWLLSLALTCGLIPQGLWIFDFLSGRLLGVHPLGLTSFLNDADLVTWIVMSHHFYLMPTLICVLSRERFYHRDVVMAAVVITVSLTVGARIALPPERNVNASHQLLPTIDRPVLNWINTLDTPRYLLMLNCVIAGGMLVPASVLLRELACRELTQIGRFPRIE